jgi:hypothetical protein
MTSRVRAGRRLGRAIKRRNFWAAESTARERGHPPPTLDYALAYLDLLAEQKPEKLRGRASLRHGRTYQRQLRA